MVDVRDLVNVFFWTNILPSGKHTKNYGKIHHFSWENSLFLWPFSIAMLNYQRVPHLNVGEYSFSIF
jgi:hypothetical protein